jgi:hypothetical protein
MDVETLQMVGPCIADRGEIGVMRPRSEESRADEPQARCLGLGVVNLINQPVQEEENNGREKDTVCPGC